MAAQGPELRVGLVLYGGVSLAVYIYGVVVEVQRLLVAGEELEAWIEAGKNREAAKELSPYARALRQAGASKVGIDLLAGTSAGGINGILLAKALARGADVYAAKKIWMEDGDIAKLMQLEEEAEPHSLLRSEFFEEKIEEGMRLLDKPASSAPEPPPVLDLFVSSTHLKGGPRRFVDALGDEISTRQHRYVFQLRLRSKREGPEARELGYTADDFTAAANPRLAKLARATSAFPAAFAPVEISGTGEPLKKGESAWFADGGILNNKPFTEAVETIVNRSSDRPVRRWLFSVDPDPKLVPGEAGAGEEPTFDRILVSAVAAIPRYQSIARDLIELEAHNQRVDAAAAAIVEGEAEIAAARIAGGGEVPPPLGPGPAAAYAALREQARNLEFADRLMEAARLPESQEVEGEREAEEEGEGTRRPELDTAAVHDALLKAAESVPVGDGADLAFERRRVYYLIKLISMAIATEPEPEAVREQLWAAYEEISSALWETLSDPALVLDPFNQADGALTQAEVRIRDGVQPQGEVAGRVGKRLRDALKDFQVRLRVPRDKGKEGEEEVVEVLLQEAFDDFDRRDAVTLAAEVYGGLRQRDRVRHAQISPLAASNTGVDPKGRLAGAALGHFGGFLDRGWRQNDIMWGRLDGAEVLVRAILEGDGEKGHDEAWRAFADEAQLGIVQEEMPDWDATAEDWKRKLGAYAEGDRSGGDLTTARLTATSLAAASTMRRMLLTAAGKGGGDGLLDRGRGVAMRSLAKLLGLALGLTRSPLLGRRARGTIQKPIEAWLKKHHIDPK